MTISDNYKALRIERKKLAACLPKAFKSISPAIPITPLDWDNMVSRFARIIERDSRVNPQVQTRLSDLSKKPFVTIGDINELDVSYLGLSAKLLRDKFSPTLAPILSKDVRRLTDDDYKALYAAYGPIDIRQISTAIAVCDAAGFLPPVPTSKDFDISGLGDALRKLVPFPRPSASLAGHDGA